MFSLDRAVRMNRRGWVRRCGAASVGLGLAGVSDRALQAAAEANAPAQRCLMIFMWGGPSHIDLFDMKPHAPAEYRGSFQPIATVTPGIEICEHLPHLAQQTGKVAFVRSMTHSDNNHSTSAHWMLTGHKHRVSAENFNARGDDSPHIGAVLSHLQPGSDELPTFVALPEPIATTAGAVVPGQGGGVLGQKYDPFRIDQNPDDPDFAVPNLALPQTISPDRLDERISLLNEFDTRLPLGAQQRQDLSGLQARAFDLLTSSAAQAAFDLQREPDVVKHRYGPGPFGQGLLLARRLLESGVKLVTVYWHRDDPGVDTTWDTHNDNFNQLQNRLIPQVDQPLGALLQDLGERGLLDDTLVVWNSEFGRTPKINPRAGRDHWGGCNTIWLAGAGVQGGTVLGRSDRLAAAPDDHPVHPADLSATIFHLLGVNPETTLHDRLGRPFAVSEGRILHEIL